MKSHQDVKEIDEELSYSDGVFSGQKQQPVPELEPVNLANELADCNQSFNLLRQCTRGTILDENLDMSFRSGSNNRYQPPNYLQDDEYEHSSHRIYSSFKESETLQSTNNLNQNA